MRRRGLPRPRFRGRAEEFVPLHSVLDVADGIRDAVLEEGAHEVLERVAFHRHVAADPAVDWHEVVVHDVAAGAFEGLDEAQGRLLAERAGQEHARLVHRASALIHLHAFLVGAAERSVLLGREKDTGAHQHVELVRGDLPRLTATQVVERADGLPILVVDADGVAQCVRVVGPGASLDEFRREALEFLSVERPADGGVEILGHVEVTHELVRKLHFPHAGEVADHVACRGEEHPVERVEAAVQAQLDRASRDVADVGLVVRIPADDLEVIPPAEDADGQHVLGVEELARHVDRHVADGKPSRALLPRRHGREAVVTRETLGLLDHVMHGGHASLQTGRRFSRKARMPSSASAVFIRSSR